MKRHQGCIEFVVLCFVLFAIVFTMLVYGTGRF